MTIALCGLRFFAYHGVFEQERKLGNQFEVDVTATVDVAASALKDDLAGTVDYSLIYETINRQMKIPCQLLERVAFDMATQILSTNERIQAVEVSVSKLNPPMGAEGAVPRATVTARQTRL